MQLLQRKTVLLLAFLSSSLFYGQDATTIYKQLEKFNFLGSVLYVAAHPDDENTRMISYFSNHVNARTAYLSMTRGDGGQNLIGTELREGLGVIRTQELLGARSIDGGEQFFTTANDFGFSKHPKETLSFWNKGEVLSQIVYRIRHFKPDIIINRFDHRTPGRTHGHHTSSAMLSVEAFDLANDPKIYPEHLKNTETWQPHRLFFNTSWYFYGSPKNFERVDKSNLVQMDTGIFDPLNGKSNSEIAALSRSQHKSQGFGSAPSFGKEEEYLEFIKGNPVKGNQLFSGIDTSWNRVKGGKIIGELTDKTLANFDFKNPSKSIPALLNIHKVLDQLPENHWKSIKKKALEELIAACAGLKLQFNATTAIGVSNSTVEAIILGVNPSQLPITVKNIQIQTKQLTPEKILTDNVLWKTTTPIVLPEKITSPYWLTKKGSIGNYRVDEEGLKGLPETPNPIVAKFTLAVGEATFELERPLVYRRTDPVAGEVIQPFHILPKVTVQTTQAAYLFTDNKPKTVAVAVKVNSPQIVGSLRLNAPENWTVEPSQQSVKIEQKGAQQTYNFTVIPPLKSSSGSFSAAVELENTTYQFGLQEIDYPHISKQYLISPNQAKAVKIDLKTNVKSIGYIRGAGDKIPESLRTIGIAVTPMSASEMSLEKLQAFKTVVVGIRAFNVNESLNYTNKILWDYVAQGGTVVVQYNTSRGLKTKEIAPFPLQLSRDRVTDEKARVTILNPEHPLLNQPNKISNQDFENWVQERGLYFPNEWDNAFTPILQMNDSGESPKKGSLLVAAYGKGQFIYTGLSFFRELPAGVPGAFRLFTNMISYGQQ